MQAAQAGGLLIEEAQQRNYLGWARHLCQGELSAAAAEHRAAYELARRVSDPREQAWSLMYLGRLVVRDDAEEAVRQWALRCRRPADHGRRAVPGPADVISSCRSFCLAARW